MLFGIKFFYIINRICLELLTPDMEMSMLWLVQWRHGDDSRTGHRATYVAIEMVLFE